MKRNKPAIITDIPTLRAMARQSGLVLHEDTGKKVRHWTGQMVTACYVSGDGPQTITWQGKQYRLEYFDGCFRPFVVEVGNSNKPGFV